MKNYLIETFQYNDFANKLVLNKIGEMQHPEECIRLFSHLINCQYKWLERITIYPEISGLDWWEPIYPMNELASHWNKSLAAWVDFILLTTEEELSQNITWVGIGNAPYTAALKDIPLQLNYHSIHHRAQMQMLLRQQGVVPDFVDYIGTKYKKVEG